MSSTTSSAVDSKLGLISATKSNALWRFSGDSLAIAFPSAFFSPVDSFLQYH